MADIVHLGRHGVHFGLDEGAGFIDEVDGLVRQEPVRDVPVGERSGGDERTVLDLHSVVHFVPLFEPSQDGDGVLDGRFIDHDGLEPAFESGILLDVLAVLVERRGTDAVEFASRQHGFQQVARVHGAFGLAGADDGVEFVDEEDDLTVRLLDFVQDGFQTFFELAAKLGARDQGAHVQREQGLVLEVVRHIALDDPLCEAFGDGRLTDAGLTDEARVVLGFPAQDPDDVSDLVVTADDRVQFLVAGHLGQVRAVFL